MTNFGKLTFRFRVYALGTNEQFEDIYDNLYEAKNQGLAESENLICCELTCSRESVEDTFDKIHELYEGMTYSLDAIVDGKLDHVVGGTCDADDVYYINDWLAEYDLQNESVENKDVSKTESFLNYLGDVLNTMPCR